MAARERRLTDEHLVELDALIAEITTDAHDEDEQLSGFSCAFEELAIPVDALVIGESVTVLTIHEGRCRMGGLAARVRRQGREYEVGLLDVEFPADSDVSWHIAAYRRWLGLEPFQAPAERQRTTKERKKRATRKAKLTLPEQVEAFRDRSLEGAYYESFSVNSKNRRDQSTGTTSWIADCNRLLVRCTNAALQGEKRTALDGFAILFQLLRGLDDFDNDIIFFADEAGSWQVGVRWDHLLPAWFEALAEQAAPDVYASTVVDLLDNLVGIDRKGHLRSARRVATPAQKRALRGA